MDMKEKLSTLWIFIMFNIVMADIIGNMEPGALKAMMTGDVGFTVTSELMLVFAMIQEVPIAMIVLSRMLKYRVNRKINIFAGVLTIVYVVAGGEAILSYYFFATMEVLCALLIIWYAWNWSEEQQK
jgi:fucose 4-O-acetylase-like acetyltransferase